MRPSKDLFCLIYRGTPGPELNTAYLFEMTIQTDKTLHFILFILVLIYVYHYGLLLFLVVTAI